MITKHLIGYKSLILFGLLISSCDPLVNEFNDIEEAIMYRANNITEFSAKDTIKVMTWNIRFGVARLRFFGDGCGDRVILKKNEVYEALEDLVEKIKVEDPDILLLQEVDVQSKKTGYIDQAQWLVDHTDFNYGAYASMWESQIILADGLGRVNT